MAIKGCIRELETTNTKAYSLRSIGYLPKSQSSEITLGKNTLQSQCLTHYRWSAGRTSDGHPWGMHKLIELAGNPYLLFQSWKQIGVQWLCYFSPSGNVDSFLIFRRRVANLKTWALLEGFPRKCESGNGGWGMQGCYHWGLMCLMQ